MENKRILEAKNCENCKGWIKYCSAECCKIIFLEIDPKKIFSEGKFLTIKLSEKLGLDEIRYYKFRDVEYLRGNLRFKKERLTLVNGQVVYLFDCEHLENNICKVQDNKPKLCKDLNLENSSLENQSFKLTDNCLFKYKCKEVKING